MKINGVRSPNDDEDKPVMVCLGIGAITIIIGVAGVVLAAYIIGRW